MELKNQLEETKDKLSYVRDVLETGGLESWQVKEYTTLEQQYNDQIDNLYVKIEEWQSVCPHPSTRIYSWFVGKTLCACCCDCGSVLAGGAS